MPNEKVVIPEIIPNPFIKSSTPSVSTLSLLAETVIEPRKPKDWEPPVKPKRAV